MEKLLTSPLAIFALGMIAGQLLVLVIDAVYKDNENKKEILKYLSIILWLGVFGYVYVLV